MNNSSQDLQSKINALFSSGLKNKFGFVACMGLMVSLFLPVVSVSLGSISNSSAMISGSSGKLLFVLALVGALLFFGGASRLFVKVLVSAVAVISVFSYYDLFSVVSRANSFGASGFTNVGLAWGVFVNVIALVALCVAAYTARYVENEKTI